MRFIILSIATLLISFQAFSQVKPINDECSQAIYVKLDTLYQQQNVLPNLDSIPFCGHNKGLYRGVWYEINGNNSILIANVSSPDAKAFILEGTCSNLSCVGYYNLDRPFTRFIEQGKTYKILIYSESASKADYSVSFSAFPTVAASKCESAPFLDCGGEMTINSNGLINSSNTACNIDNGGYKFLWFRIRGNGGVQKIQYNLSEFIPINYYVYDVTCSDTMHCILNGSYVETFSLISELNKEYLVQLELNSAITSPISVSLNCTSLEPTLQCDGAKPLICGQRYENEQLQNINVNSLNQEVSKQYGLWYKLPREVGKQIQLKFDASNYGPMQMRLYKSNTGDCSELLKVYENNINVSSDQFYLDIIDDEQYYMLLSEYSNIPFNLTVSCTDIDYNNNSCQNSETINPCGDTISFVNSFCLNKTNATLGYYFDQSGKWFRFVGDSLPLVITSMPNTTLPISIYKSTCGAIGDPILSGLYLNDVGKAYFNVAKGQEYYIRINYVYSSNIQNFTINFECLDADLSGLRCEDAIELHCGEQSAIQLNYLIANTLQPSDCGPINSNSWYKIVGDGGTKSLSGEDIYRIEVYKSTNCQDFECYAIPIYQNYVTFPTEEGVTYYCLINGNPYHGIVTMRCVDETINDSCAKAKLITCTDGSIPFDITNAYQLDSTSFKSSSLWYKMVGDDKPINIYTKQYTNIVIHDSCDQDTIARPYSTNYKMLLQKDKTYIIELLPSGYPLDTLHLSCGDYFTENSFCTNAVEMVCDTTFEIDLANSLSGSGVINQDTVYFSYKTAWYQFEGDGQTWIFSPIDNYTYTYELYVDDCDNVPIASALKSYYDLKFVINSEIGKTYKIRLNCYDNLDSIKFSIGCSESITNFNCQQATVISCDTTVTLKPNELSQDLILIPDRGLLKNVRWYKLESPENSAISFGNDSSVGIVYESNNDCDSLKQLMVVTGTEPIIIDRKVGMSYYLAFGNFYSQVVENDFVLHHFCLPKNIDYEEYSCNNRIVLECGTNYEMNNVLSFPSSFNNCTSTSTGHWFEVVGNGSYYQLDIEGDQTYFSSTSVILGEGNSCADVQCTCILSLNQFGQAGFQSEVGKKYFIKISNNYLYGLALKNVQLNCFEDLNNHTCAQPLTVACGQKIVDLITTTIPEDAVNVCQTNYAGNYYVFQGTGDNITFKFNSISGNTLYYEIIENSCVDGRCLFTGAVESGYYGKNQFTLDSKLNTNYIIKLHSAVDCTYEFTTSCFETHENVSCQASDVVQCGNTYNLNLQSPLGLSTTSICSTGSGQIEHWFQLPKNKKWFEFTFDTSSLNTDVSISYIKGSCNALECIQSWDYATNQIAVFGNDNDDYYLKITRSYNGQNLDSIKFILNCIEGKINDFCDGATFISCGFHETNSTYLSSFSPVNENCSTLGYPDIWYKLIGNDSIYLFEITNILNSGSFTAYQASDCTQLACEGTQATFYSAENSFALYTKKDSTYYIRIQNAYSYLTYKFDMKVGCLPNLENDVCSGAIPIDVLSDTIVANVYLASSDLPSLTDCNQNFVYPITNGLWYSFEGTGGVISFTKADESSPIRYLIFEGNCDQWQCIKNDVLYYESLDINTELGKSYKMVVYSNDMFAKTLTFYVKKKVLEINAECSSPIALECGTEVIMDKSKLVYSDEYRCNTYGGHSKWYTIESDTSFLLRVNSITVYNGLYWLVYDSCMTECKMNIELPYSGGSTQIIVPKGQKYLIESRSNLQFYSQPFVYNTSCLDIGYTHTSFETALALPCEKLIVNPSKTGFALQHEIESFPSALLFYKFSSKKDTFIQYVPSVANPLRMFVYNSITKQIGDITFGAIINIEKDVVYYLLVDCSVSGFVDSDFEFEIQGHCSEVATTDIDVYTSLKVIPNPFSDHFEVQFNKPIEANSTLEILDMVGNEVLSIDLSNHVGAVRYKLSGLEYKQDGLYYARYTSPTYSKVVKIIKIGRD